jgi:hypothetical protein
MAYATREAILAQAERRERDEESLFGTLRLRELARIDYRAISTAAEIPGRPGHIYVDIWHAGVFAAVVIDPETHEPLFTTDEVLAWGNRNDLWAEVIRIVTAGLDLSEVGPDALTKSGPEPDAG